MITTDLDRDGLVDTIYMDTTNVFEDDLKAAITCKLSSKQYKPIHSLPTYYDKENPNSAPLTVTENGFSYSANGMRAGQEYEFSFDIPSQKMRLVSSYIFNLGNVVGDGAQEIIIDLRIGTIKGGTSFFDYQNDDIISTTIEEKKHFEAIYLEESSSDIELWYPD